MSSAKMLKTTIEGSKNVKNKIDVAYSIINKWRNISYSPNFTDVLQVKSVFNSCYTPTTIKLITNSLDFSTNDKKILLRELYNFSSWTYTADLSIKIGLTPDALFKLNRWKYNNSGLNFRPLLETLELSNTATCREHILGNTFKELDILQNELYTLQLNIAKYEKYSKEDTMLLEQIKNGETTTAQIAKKYEEFEDYSFFRDDLSGKLIKPMVKMIKNEPVVLTQLLNSYDKSITDVMKYVDMSKYPDINDSGHTGMSMYWTLKQTKYIFEMGWFAYVELCINKNLYPSN